MSGSGLAKWPKSVWIVAVVKPVALLLSGCVRGSPLALLLALLLTGR